jgi:hypothetical protein
VALRHASSRLLRQSRRVPLAPVRVSVSACGRPTSFHERSEFLSQFQFQFQFQSPCQPLFQFPSLLFLEAPETLLETGVVDEESRAE